VSCGVASDRPFGGPAIAGAPTSMIAIIAAETLRARILAR